MDNTRDHVCTCSSLGYSPDCPEVFLQGNRMMHSISAENKLKPRVYQSFDSDDEITVESSKRFEKRDIADESSNKTLPLRIQPKIQKLRSESYESHVEMRSGVVGSGGPVVPIESERKSRPRLFVNESKTLSSEHLKAENRQWLQKYEPLTVGDDTLTQLSIGGFPVDLAKAAQKASIVAPLPPARLPKIYIEDEMNFLHHFFQGLERLMGRERMLSIVVQDRHYTSQNMILLPLIEEILKIGWEKKDSDLTVFTKTVLTSTFESEDGQSPDFEYRSVRVAANLWGFQYIESGMECREADLCMWLSVSYNHFKNTFFNTFKDSGMPAFAMEGVQRRYEEFPERQQSISRLHSRVHELQTTRSEKMVESDRDDSDTRSQASGRRRKQRRPEPTIGSMLFGRSR